MSQKELLKKYKKTPKKNKKNPRNTNGMKTTNEFGLTPLQAKFCEEYIIEQNGKQSYINAGYKCSPKSAETGASRMLSSEKVQAYIKYLMELARSKAVANKQEILEFLTSVIRGEVEDQYSDKPGIRDRTEAAKLLGKQYGMFNDKVEVQGNVKHEHSGPTKADELIAEMFDPKKDNATKVS